MDDKLITHTDVIKLGKAEKLLENLKYPTRNEYNIGLLAKLNSNYGKCWCGILSDHIVGRSFFNGNLNGASRLEREVVDPRIKTIVENIDNLSDDLFVFQYASRSTVCK